LYRGQVNALFYHIVFTVKYHFILANKYKVRFAACWFAGTRFSTTGSRKERFCWGI